MRTATKHPTINVAKPVLENPTPVIVSSAPSVLGVDNKRIERAKRVHQDKRISRFGSFDNVEPSPAVQPIQPSTATPQAAIPEQPQAQPVASPTKTHLERAIAAATSHTQPKAHPKPKRHHAVARKLHMKPRTVTAATMAVLVIGVGGLMLRQNMPALQVQLAGNRAGVSSHLPSEVPSGFNLASGIDYKDGEVMLTYQSQAQDGRAFTITQTESFWTSDSLRENFLETQDGQYQTVQQNGKTIYLYDGGATWVDGGIWYKINSNNASLSSDQLTELVNGL